MIVSSLSDGFSGEGDAASLMNALGSLWLAGVQPDWAAVQGEQLWQRISLPTYPFERKRYWLEGAAERLRSCRSRPVADGLSADLLPKHINTGGSKPVNASIQTSPAGPDAAEPRS